MRQALIDFDVDLWFAPRPADGESLPRLIDVLKAHGLSVTGSAAAPYGAVRLVIEGDGLPAECDSGWAIVRPTFSSEQHGSQHIVRVGEVQFAGRPDIIPV